MEPPSHQAHGGMNGCNVVSFGKSNGKPLRQAPDPEPPARLGNSSPANSAEAQARGRRRSSAR
eukprot:scaffold1471_cov413-Prasinococcus_capsulatus_cf.AAC.26